MAWFKRKTNESTRAAEPDGPAPAPGSLEAEVAAWRAKFDLQNEVYSSEASVAELWEWYYALTELRDLNAASALLYDIRPSLEAALAQAPEAVWAAERMIEWHHNAMRFLRFDPDDFAEFSFYAEIFALTDEREGIVFIRGQQARLGLLNNYQNWVQQGGDAAALPEDQAEFLADLHDHQLDRTLDLLAELHAAQRYEELVPLKRSLYRYYRQSQQPNAAVGIMKELLHDLPHLPDYQASDSADVNLELGHLFMQYAKPKVAQQYYEAAQAQYLATGEAFEIMALQAESLAQDAQALAAQPAD
jgi:hypothetical protein